MQSPSNGIKDPSGPDRGGDSQDSSRSFDAILLPILEDHRSADCSQTKVELQRSSAIETQIATAVIVVEDDDSLGFQPSAVSQSRQVHSLFTIPTEASQTTTATMTDVAAASLINSPRSSVAETLLDEGSTVNSPPYSYSSPLQPKRGGGWGAASSEKRSRSRSRSRPQELVQQKDDENEEETVQSYYTLNDCTTPSVLTSDDYSEQRFDWYRHATTGDGQLLSTTAAASSYTLPNVPASSHRLFSFLGDARSFEQAIRSYMLGGLDEKRSTLKSMVASLPSSIHFEAEARLEPLLKQPSVSLRHTTKPSSYIASLLSQRRSVYIGITERPLERWHTHQQDGRRHMAVWVRSGSSETAALERSLIAEFRRNPLLENVGRGGERASAAQPHFLYVVYS